jgi:hypothetical protein
VAVSETYEGGSALTGPDDISREQARLEAIRRRIADGPMAKPTLRRGNKSADYPESFLDAYGREQAYRVADDGRKLLKSRQARMTWLEMTSSKRTVAPAELRRIREATAYRENFDGPELLRATAASQGNSPLDVVLQARDWQDSTKAVGPDPVRGTVALVPAIPTPTPEPDRTVARVVTRAGIRTALRDYKGRTIRYL